MRNFTAFAESEMNQLSLGFRNQSFNRIAKLSSGLAIKSVNLVICHDYFLPRSGHSDELREIDRYNYQEYYTEGNNIFLRSNYNSLLLVFVEFKNKSVVQMISPPRAGRQKKNCTISGTEVNLVVGEARDSHPQLSASPLRTSGIMMQHWRQKERKDGLLFPTRA